MEVQNVNYMKGYFAQAAELEKHIFVLKESMKKANQEMNLIYKEKETVKQKEEGYNSQLANLDKKYADKAQQMENTLVSDKANLPTLKRRSVFMLVGLIFFGCLVVFGMLLGAVGSLFENELLNFGGAAIGILSFYASIPFLILFIVNKIKAGRASSRLNGKKRDFDKEKENEKNNIIMEINNTQHRSKELVQSKNELIKMQDMISEQYKVASNALQRLYGKNLIASKYRNFQAMATFYEYLSTGRCIAVVGPGGVVDTYEKDLQAKIMINHLSNIEAIVDDTNNKVGYLCDQAEQANRQLRSINSNLSAIKVSSAATAMNTAQIANYCGSINDSIHRMERNYF